jgi:hypothetical protein
VKDWTGRFRHPGSSTARCCGTISN